MRVATFMPISGSLTLGHYVPTGATYPGQITLGTYDDNVTRQHEYWYFDSATAIEAEVEPGWYLTKEDPDEGTVPDFGAGVQNAVELPYGRACVMVSIEDGANYNTQGNVALANVEIQVDQDHRRMTGNSMPRAINISEITTGNGESATFPGQLTLGTYDDNVTRQHEYWYFDPATATEAEVEVGWYLTKEDPDEGTIPDFEAGVQSFTFAPGQGFVMTSMEDGAVFTLPKAL